MQNPTIRLLIILLALSFLSCGDSKTTQDKQVEKSALSIVAKHRPIQQLNPSFKREIEQWSEYNTLDTYIQKFQHISPNEALANAKELKDISKTVLDSIRPQFLQTAAFKARANVLLNETLRLEDMVSIIAITAPEVNAQVEKILTAYSSINSKISMSISKERLEKEILNINYNTLPVDSLDKKSIKKSVQNEFDLNRDSKPIKLNLKKKKN